MKILVYVGYIHTILSTKVVLIHKYKKKMDKQDFLMIKH